MSNDEALPLGTLSTFVSPAFLPKERNVKKIHILNLL